MAVISSILFCLVSWCTCSSIAVSTDTTAKDKKHMIRRNLRGESVVTTKATTPGYIFISGDDTDHHVVAWTALPELDISMEAVLSKCLTSSGNTQATKDILALGIQSTGVDVPAWTFNSCGGASHAYQAFTRWVAAIGNPSYDILTEPADVAAVNFADYKMIYMPSQKTVSQCSNHTYTLCDIEAVLAARSSDLQYFLHDLSGSLFALEQSTEPKNARAYKTTPGVVTKGDTITLDEGCPDAFAWFPLPLVSSVVQSSNVMATSKFLADFDANAVQTAIDHKFFHVAFTGPVGYNGMDVLMEDTDVSGNAYALGGESNTIIPAPPSPSAAPSTIKPSAVPSATPSSAPTSGNCPFNTTTGLPVKSCCGGTVTDVVLDASVTFIGKDAFSTDARWRDDDGLGTDLCSNIVTVTAPGVTAVGDYAFSGLTHLTAFSAPNLATIGYRAFEATGLTSFDFTYVTSIGAHAFSKCALKGAIAAPLLTTVANAAFYECKSITSFDGPLVNTIERWAFSSSSALTSFNGPLVNSIGIYAFFRCSALTSFDGPLVASIGYFAFYGCSALTSFNGPLLTTVKHYAFYGCSSLTSFDGPLVALIGYYAFYGCSLLTSFDGPLVTKVEDHAFYGCSSLTSVDLPVVTEINEFAFHECSSLSNFTSPALISIGKFTFVSCTSLISFYGPAVTSIASGGFQFCSSLTSVDIPVATEIGESAFYECTALTSFTASPSLSADNIGDDAFYSTNLYCTQVSPLGVGIPCSGIPTGIPTSAPSGIPTSAPTPGNCPFDASAGYPVNACCGGLTDVVLDSSVTNIAGRAFYHCDSLKSVSAPGATVVREGAFQGCASLVSFDGPLVDSIGAYGFADCPSLASIAVPLVTSVGELAFDHGSSLLSFSGPFLTSIGNWAFKGCTSLTTFTASPSLSADNIGVDAFEDDNNLVCAQVSPIGVGIPCSGIPCSGIPSGIPTSAPSGIPTGIPTSAPTAPSGIPTGIPTSAPSGIPTGTPTSAPTSGNCPFDASAGYPVNAYCGGLTDVVLDSSVTNIAGGAFYHCGSLKSVSAPGATVVRDIAFQGCASLVSFDGPSVDSIGAYGFADCPSLASIAVPLVTSVGELAFDHGSSLLSFSGPLLTSIGNWAFKGCTSLTTFTASPSLSADNIGVDAFKYDNHLICAQVSPLGVGIPCNR